MFNNGEYPFLHEGVDDQYLLIRDLDTGDIVTPITDEIQHNFLTPELLIDNSASNNVPEIVLHSESLINLNNNVQTKQHSPTNIPGVISEEPSVHNSSSNIEAINVEIVQNLNQEASNSFQENLMQFLVKRSGGKTVLRHYDIKKQLNKESRGILVRLVIGKIKDDALSNLKQSEKLSEFRISRATFTDISHSIEKIFPGEKASTYYTPYWSEGNVVVPTSGALWEHYNYTKGVLKEQNLLEKSKSRSQKEESCVNLEQDKEQINAALERLKTSLNLESRQNDWILTHNARKILLLAENYSVAEYFKTFPCLEIEQGIKQLELDFTEIYPCKSGLLSDRWNTIKTVLINQLQELEKKKIRDVDDNAYLKLLPTLNGEAQDAVDLHLLCLLSTQAGVGRKRKNCSDENIVRRWSPAERRETFMCHIEISDELEEKIRVLKSKLWNRKETFQPLFIVVGPLINIEEAYVVVEDQQYKTSSCLEALDLCFKLFFSLHCHYPKASHSMWHFFQLVGYSIVTLPNNPIKSVKELQGLTEEALKQAKLL